jgi:hypothetical protein
VSVHSSSGPSLDSMRARLRTVALNLLTAFWGGRSGNIDLKPIICGVRDRNGARSMRGIEKPLASSSDRSF